MPIRHNGTEYDYDLTFVVDLSKFEHVDPIEDADELFEYPASVVYTTVPYCFTLSCQDGTANEIQDNIREMINEWMTLLIMNDCKDRKLKVSIHVEEVS